MLTLTLAAFVLSAAPALHAGAPVTAPVIVTVTASERLIAAVPEGAVAVAYCESLPNLRERAEENTWYRLLRSDAGEVWREAANDALADDPTGMGQSHELLRALWDRLPGGAVVFMGTTGGGLVLDVTGVEADVEALLAKVLEEPRRDWQRADLEHGTFAVEAYAPTGAVWETPAVEAADPTEGREALAPTTGTVDDGALILARGNGHLFLLAGGDAAATLQLARTSIDGWSSGKSTSGDRFRGARSSVGGGGLEFFADLTPMMAEAENEIRNAGSVFDVDPTSLLGLQGDTWVYTTLELFRGDRMEARGRLHVPSGGIAARTLATLRPLPVDLLARVPADAVQVSAFGWDIPAFFDLVSDIARELMPDGEGMTLDNALEAGNAALGVNLREDFIGQFSGLFMSWLQPMDAETGDDPLEALMSTAWLIGLRDGAVFQNAMEQILDIAGVLDTLTLTDVEGSDIYYADGANMGMGTGWSPGVAFAPGAVLFGARHTLLEAGLRTLAGGEGATSLLGSSRFAGAYDENLGAVAFGAVELGAVQAFVMPGGVPAEVRGAADEGRDPFGRMFVWSVRPTGNGLDFRAATR